MWKIFSENIEGLINVQNISDPVSKRKSLSIFYKYNIFIHICWICIRNSSKDTPKTFTAVTTQENEGVEHSDFSPFFFMWFEFLQRRCHIWDRERHRGRDRHPQYTGNPVALLRKPLQHQQSCLRNVLYFEDFEFSQKQTLSQGLRSKCFTKKVPPGELRQTIGEAG